MLSFCKKILIGVLLISIVNKANTNDIEGNKRRVLNVAVVGAGVSGLSSAKHSLDRGYNVTIYEQTEQLGGIWVYTNKTGKDKYGAPIYSPMYKGMRTSVPHEIMEYPNFSYPNGTMSYPMQPAVLKYVHSYANHFNLRKHIKFSHIVVKVDPIVNGKWKILVKDLRTNQVKTEIHDIVFVCNGHNSVPSIPKFHGASNFVGKMIHSRDFRQAEAYKNQRVLIIGGGPSGKDLARLISRYAKHVTLSVRKGHKVAVEASRRNQSGFSQNITIKNEVICFYKTGAEFVDGSYQTFDAVIFATGYKYSFPFLNTHQNESIFQLLYKEIFNIEHPTMAFIGLPLGTSYTKLFDLQVRFALKYLSGEKKLPTKAAMLRDIHKQLAIKRPYSIPSDQKVYMRQLANATGIIGVPDVFVDIGADSAASRDREPYDYQNYKYIILNDKRFKKEKIKNL